MAPVDDDPIDATLEGAPILDDTNESSESSEALWASTEAPAGSASRPVTPSRTSSPPPLMAPPTQRAAATVVARLADVIGSDGISFDASEADGEASGFEDGATRPELERAPPPAPPTRAPPTRAPPTRAPPTRAPPTQTPTTTATPRIRPAEPPPDFEELAGTAPPTTLPPTTLPPMRPRMETRGPMVGVGLPGSGLIERSGSGPGPGAGSGPVARSAPAPMALPTTTTTRREARPPTSVGVLDPPVPPATSSPRRETRGPTAGMGGLDPPVTPKTTRPARSRSRDVDVDGAAVSEGPAAPPDVGGGGTPLKALLGVVVVALVVVVLARGGAGSVGGSMNPADALTLADRARAALSAKTRTNLEEPVRGIARTIIGEGARVVVVRDKSGDAWLLPDGGVIVTDGLLRRLSSDAQLAAIVAHLTAHHELGHVGALALDLDGPAVIAASTAAAGIDERETDTHAVALLRKAGWRTRALVEAEDALGAGPWAARHKRRATEIVSAAGPDGGGREDKSWYEQHIRSQLGAP